ncbi:MAG: site-specific integrase [Nitrososphaerota archaeon]|nr:site-specific integrase [Nitrososphaerota archaeon]
MNIKGSEGAVFDVHRATEKLLLSDPDTKSWLAGQPQRTRDGNFRRLGRVCATYGKTPADLKKLSPKEAYAFLLQVRDDMAAQGKSSNYIGGVIYTLRGFFTFNDIMIVKRLHIQRTSPVFSKVPPSTEEVHDLLRSSGYRTRAAISLVAFSGLRPEVIGNYGGTDGLKVGDVEGLSVNGRAEFTVVPCRISVRAELSKNGRPYFSFLNSEGVSHLKSYLDWRLMKSLERLTADSPLITSDPHQGRFGRPLKAKDVSMLIRKPMRQLWGKKYRPYALRHWFKHAVVNAEADGLVPSVWSIFWFGHSGTIESVYSTQGLADKDITKMREAYQKVSEAHLSTSELPVLKEISKEREALQAEVERLRSELVGRSMDRGGVLATIRKEMLSSRYGEMEIEEMGDLSKLTTEQFVEAFNRKALGLRGSQKVVPAGEVRGLIEQGWEYVSQLPDGYTIVRLPRGGLGA